MLQGIYTMKPGAGTDAYGGVQLDVSTFCVHGGPSGKFSGITGAVIGISLNLFHLDAEN